MIKSKLGIDFERVAYAKGIARDIASEVQQFVDNYTTVAVERTIARILGIDGTDANGVPLPNVVVDAIKSANLLSEGVMYVLGSIVKSV